MKCNYDTNWELFDLEKAAERLLEDEREAHEAYLQARRATTAMAEKIEQLKARAR